MSRIVAKIIVITLVIGLNWSGLFAIGQVLAYYFDSEESPENTFAAGSLDFVLLATELAAKQSSLNLEPGMAVDQGITVENVGTLPFQYFAQIGGLGGDADFCSER